MPKYNGKLFALRLKYSFAYTRHRSLHRAVHVSLQNTYRDPTYSLSHWRDLGLMVNSYMLLISSVVRSSCCGGCGG